MAPKESKISKKAAAVTTRHITFTIPETLVIIRNLQGLHAMASLWQQIRLDC